MASNYGERTALKQRLNIETAETSMDAALDSALAAASRGIDKACGRRFWLDPDPVERTFSTRGRVADGPDGALLLVDDIGNTTGMTVLDGSSAVTAYETTPDNAVLDGQPVTGLLLPSGTWGSRVKVTARYGWPTVPEDVQEAALIQAARLYRRKDSPEGIAGNAEWGVLRLSRRDPDVWALISPYIAPNSFA